MDMQKMKRMKDSICDRLEALDANDLAKPAMVEYAKNLASLHCKLCTICESEEGGGSYRSSMRGGDYRDGIEWGAYDNGMSMRRGRNAMGRYTSYDNGYSEGSYGGSAKDKIREMLENPNLNREDREALKQAMERMR